MNLFFFYKGSEGELHTGLPVIEELNINLELNIFYIFENPKEYNKIENYYKDIISKNGKVILEKSQILKLLLRNLLNKNIIMTCTNGHTKFSSLFANFSLKSSVFFFHHAYALTNNDININKLKINKMLYKASANKPNILLNNFEDINYYQNFGFSKENYVYSGYLGYSKKWLKIINKYIDKSIIDINLNYYDNFEYKILVPIRNHHDFYLTKENYDYQIESIIKISKKYTNYLFIIKPHPRQTDLDYLNKLSKKYKNIIISNFNIIYLAQISDLVISFWSSSILDVLSANKPVIEFHKHEIYHPELIFDNNKLNSLYVKKGMCKNIDNYEELEVFIDNKEHWENELNISQKNFKLLFKTNDNFISDFTKKTDLDFKIKLGKYIKNLLTIYIEKIFIRIFGKTT